MSAISDALAGRSGQGLSSILAQLNALLTPTEQLPGTQSPYSVLLAQPGMMSRPAPMASTSGASNATPGASHGPSSLQGLLKEAGPLKSAISSLFAPSLATYAGGAPADSAVTAALGNVGAQTAPTAASIQAGNDAALAASNGGAAGAGAGLLGMGQIGSGLAADSAVTGTLGSVGAQTAGDAAAIQAANDAALGGSAATSGGSGAATGAGLGAGAGAAAALGAVALPLALAAFVPTGENAQWWSGLSDQIKGTGQYANMSPQDRQFNQSAGAIELMSMLKQGEPTPYSSQQVAAMGITPQLIAEAFPTISSPSGTAQGWLGGSGRGLAPK